MRRPEVRQMMRAAGAEVDRFCEEWIGWTLPPVSRVLEESLWRRDPRRGYCHRCGQTLGMGEASAAGCGACRGLAIPTHGVVRLGSYSEQLREWVLCVKFGRWIEMGRFLGQELGEALRGAAVVELPRTVVTPMPMPWLRRVHRGIDHSAVIAGCVARVLGVPLVPILAKRSGPTQLTVPKQLRALNARRGMALRRRWGGWPLEDLHIVVVDDVRTTGASMAAAARLLRSVGAKHIVEAVVAVADSGRRSVKSTVDKPQQDAA